MGSSFDLGFSIGAEEIHINYALGKGRFKCDLYILPQATIMASFG
jgi:hypothetical protein